MRASRSSRPAFRSYALKHSLPCQMDMDADLTEVAGTLPKVRLLTTPGELAWTCNTKITVIHLFSAVVERYCTGTMNMKFGYHMHSAARCEGKPSPVFVLFELILFVLQVGQRRRGKDEVYARVDIRRTRSFCSNAQWPSVFFLFFFLFLRPWVVYPRCFFPISKKEFESPPRGQHISGTTSEICVPAATMPCREAQSSPRRGLCPGTGLLARWACPRRRRKCRWTALSAV